ncbi:MAG TPA: Rrf2 family transcriptional regulator [Patescibacteria group bacterium]|nr:Rrf2 family transcriptional regulator [Patescibacteria group bacterium]
MKVSAKEEYGLRCMLQLARRQSEERLGQSHQRPEPLSLAEIARHEGLTVAYVAKLIARLRRAGLVRSVLGRSGGYTLARDASEISVLEVLGPLGGKLYNTDYCNRFAGDMKGCAHLDDCSMRALWGVVEGLLDRVLGQTMLTDLIGTERHALALLDGRSPAIMPIVRRSR